jgi:hypothetical protein
MEKPKVSKKLLNDLDSELSGNPIGAQIMIPAGMGDAEAPEHSMVFMPNGSFRPAANFYRDDEVFKAEDGIINEVQSGGNEIPYNPAGVDLFGDPLPVVKQSLPPETFPDNIMGADIIKIRALTGKARKNADDALRAAAVEFLAAASEDCFWVPGNVASSKNSKDIGFYLKKSQKTGKMERIHVLVDSAITKKYKTATKGYWLQNKIEFLNQTRHLPLPLHIEFTFIRDSLRAFDFINACQVIADLMKDNGYYTDDDSCHFLPIFNPVVYYHPETPGVLFRVLKEGNGWTD